MYHKVVRLLSVCISMGFGFLHAAWSPPDDLSATGQNASDVQIAVDANGNATAVWLRSDGTNFIVQASTKPFGGIWQAVPNDLSASIPDVLLPQIAVDANGNATAVWTRGTGTGIIVQASTKLFGGNWQAVPDDLSADGQNAALPQIAVDASGNVTVVWLETVGSYDIIQASTKLFGGNWQVTPDDLSAADKNARRPQIAVDDNGNATAVWLIPSGAIYTIQASTKLFNGTWQAIPDDLSVAGQDAGDAQIAVDANGNVTAVWAGSNGTNYIVQASAKPFGGTWQAIPNDLSASGQNASGPQIAVDANGNATVVWERSNGTNTIIQSSTKPFNGAWQATPDDLSAIGQDAQRSQIAVDANGNATAVWERFNGTNYIIQASTKPFGGTWQAVPDDLSAIGQDAVRSQIAVDANGNATAVWERDNGTNSIIQASTQSQPFPGPTGFRGKVKRSKHKLFIKTRWNKSTINNVVRYEIFARHKKIKKISAHEKPQATIHLHPHSVPHHISKKYRHYIHNKYKIRSVGASGTLSPFTQLKVQH
jgi:hypothetical protein